MLEPEWVVFMLEPEWVVFMLEPQWRLALVEVVEYERATLRKPEWREAGLQTGAWVSGCRSSCRG